MVYRVVITQRAELDVEQALAWYREQGSPAVAARWFERWLTKVASLETHPERFPLAAESATLEIEVREALVGSRAGGYRILFRIVGQVVEILRLRHTARDVLTSEELD
ncbi:MAG TPA: type II toxin-antitoxin system RelE/ParE family toxin [Pirellulales bacterium]